MTDRQTRADDSRSATSRIQLGGEPRGRLDIDISGLAADVSPRWIRENSRGEYDDDNVQSAMERGFSPVTTADLPTYTKFARLPGAPKAAANDTLIRRGGMVLMARPRYLDDQERAMHAKETRGAVRSVARDLAAQRDGTNVKDLPDATVSLKIEQAVGSGRFSEPTDPI